MAPAPDWYPDPGDASQLRYWNGVRWTDHRAPAAAPQRWQTAPPTQAVAVGTQNGVGGSAKGGKWYFVLTIASAGLLACVPIFHAASALGETRLRKLGVAYAGAGGLLLLLATFSPTTEAGTSPGTLSSLGGLVSIVTVVAACIQLTPLRRRVYGAGTPTITPPPGTRDAVAAVQRARVQRTTARELASRDPLMARELRIGRPDLPRDYDDGGLVDLNAAPAQTIADFCQVPESAARAITDARAAIGRFSSVEEAMLYANVDYDTAAVIKDRAVVI